MRQTGGAQEVTGGRGTGAAKAANGRGGGEGGLTPKGSRGTALGTPARASRSPCGQGEGADGREGRRLRSSACDLRPR